MRFNVAPRIAASVALAAIVFLAGCHVARPAPAGGIIAPARVLLESRAGFVLHSTSFAGVPGPVATTVHRVEAVLERISGDTLRLRDVHVRWERGLDPVWRERGKAYVVLSAHPGLRPQTYRLSLARTAALPFVIYGGLFVVMLIDLAGK